MHRSVSSYFCCAHVAWIPSIIQYICPFAARPWRHTDLEELRWDDEGNRIPPVPFLNVKGFVDFRDNDPENPRNWSAARRWYISVAAIFLAVNGSLTSSVTGGCLQSISKQFCVSELAAGVSTALFTMGYCTGPFVFAPISEFCGRRWLIYGTFTLYVAFNFLCAFAPGFAALLIGRFLSGTFVSGSFSAVPGILSDLWNPVERDNSVALLALTTWASASLGPVVAAFVDETKGWRWVFYLVLLVAALGVLAMVTIPETHAPTILAEKAARHRHAEIPGYENVKTEGEHQHTTLCSIYKRALTRPWELLFDPISLCCNIYLFIVCMLQFMLFSIYPIVFHHIRGWNTVDAELPLLGAVVGPVLGAVVVVVDTQRRRKKEYDTGQALDPEERLVIAKLGGVGFAVTIFSFTWTAPFKSVHWICPTLAGGLLSASLLLVFVAILNYLIEVYVEYPASIVAVNTVARSLGSSSAPLYTNFMFSSMGVRGGGSLIGATAVVLAVIPFVFYTHGSRLRRKSRYPSSMSSDSSQEQVGEPQYLRR